MRPTIDIMPIERRLSFLSWTLDVERWTLGLVRNEI